MLEIRTLEIFLSQDSGCSGGDSSLLYHVAGSFSLCN